MTKPSLPQGVRDFSPQVVRRRNYIFSTLRAIFERYGFDPIETPAFENLQTLTGKYGEEGDRLIFKILNNGLHEKKDKDSLNAEWARLTGGPTSSVAITERALRYDLTIPFARYVVQHQADIAFPFRRYQMQPVWRADRPQRGRYREFWQCDCDVVGSDALLNEAELICIYAEAFSALNLPQVSIKLNSRKILAALAEVCGAPELMTEITVALDKLDKVGWDGVQKELVGRGLNDKAISVVERLTQITGSNEEKLDAITALLGSSETGQKGIAEIRDTLALYAQLANTAWPAAAVVDFSLARGLNYYTGIILEVTTDAVKMGSIGGGGRYDDLTGLFGLKGLSGVGISFGIDRIYDVLEELNAFPEEGANGTRVLLLHTGEAQQTTLLRTLTALRIAGIAAELYPQPAKLDKQFKYADKRSLPFVLIIGEKEAAENKMSLKNMKTGEQQLLSLEGVLEEMR